MRIWLIEDWSNNRYNCTFPIGFETEKACRDYIARNGNPGWKLQWITVWNDEDAARL